MSARISLFFASCAVLFVMPAQAEENMWRFCADPVQTVPTNSPKNSGSTHIPDPSTNREMKFSADKVEVEGSLYRLKGNVVGGRGDQQISADTLDYDKDSEIAQAKGNVRYERGGRTVTGDIAEINVAKDTGVISPARFWLADKHIRGEADSIKIEGATGLHLEKSVFTTCDEGSEDWYLKASSLYLDSVNNEGVARHARINFMHVPIFYFPYLSFPLQGRKTGFLVPAIGDSNDSGTEISVPYYWNIAPHRDATLTPHYMSRRGLLMEGEFRYLNKHNVGQIELSHITNDEVFGEDRSALNFKHQGNPAPGWGTQMIYGYVSDGDYLDDFGTDLAISSTTHLERRADLNYRSDSVQANLFVQDYQTLDESLPETSKPYQRLPQLQINTRDWKGYSGFNFGLAGEAVHFVRKESVVGSRLDVQPRLSLPWYGAPGFIIPKLTWRHTQYQLNKSDPAYDDSPSRSLPIFSLDSGLIFERELMESGWVKRQTLEPRLFYLHVPHRDQNNLIVNELGADSVFDSSLSPFSFSQLFRENRFVGGDRVGDANQLSAAITTRFLDESGRELLSASLGRIFYFQDREVTLPGGLIETDTTSDWAAELKSQWSPVLRARASMLWDRQKNKMEQGSVDLLYHRDNRRIFRLAYRYEEGLLEQGDIALIWPLASRWNIVGRWLYSLQDDVTLETLKGVEYESCCWSVRIVQRRHRRQVDTLDEVDKDSIWLQLELKGLTSVGRQVKDMLSRDILAP